LNFSTSSYTFVPGAEADGNFPKLVSAHNEKIFKSGENTGIIELFVVK
jgi:hypothetical protein